MAKSVLELAVGTGQWDAGLKKAKSALDNFVQSNGGLSQALDKESQKMQQFVKMMGGMESSAKTAKGQMNDYKGTIEQLTMQYNRMTDAQKQAVGPDYLHAIDQLRDKYQSVNKEIQEMNRSLKDVKAPDINTGGDMLGGIGSKLDGAMAVFGGNMMTKAAGAVAQLGSEIADTVKQGIEMAKAGEGIRIAFERLGRGDILQGLRDATHGTVTDLELMKAAVKFNDFKLPLEELGTMLAFAQQKAKDTGQSVDYMVDSIVTGLGRKSLMILDNLGLSATEVRDKMQETGDMTKAVGAIIRDQMAKAGDYVETAADRATQANVSLQNKMEELGRKFGPVEEASNQLWTSIKIGILDIIGGPLATMLNQLTEAGRLRNQLNKMNGDPSTGQPTKVQQQLSTLRGSNYQNANYKGQLSRYDKQISTYQTMIDNGGKLPGAPAGSGKDVRWLQSQMDALKAMRAEYVQGAKDIMKPAEANVKTDKAVQNVKTLTAQLKDLEEQRKKAVKSGDQEQVDKLTKQINQTKTNLGYLDPSAVKTGSGKKNVSYESDSIMAQEKLVADLTQKWKTASDSVRDDYAVQLDAAKAKLKEMQDSADPLKAIDKQFQDMSEANYDTGYQGSQKAKEDGLRGDFGQSREAFASAPISTQGVEQFIAETKNLLSQANIGSELYAQLSEQLNDSSQVSQLLQQYIANGITGADLGETAQELKNKLLNGEIDDDVMQQYVDQLNEKLKEKFDETEWPNVLITFDADTKKIVNAAKQQEKEAREMAKDWQAAGSAIQAVGTAMSQIEDPAAKVLGTIAQAVATMAMSYAQAANSPAVTGTGWGWIAFAATGLATMLTSVNAIKQATAGFANGGVVKAANGAAIPGTFTVPGTTFSGDQIPAMLNAGETVLTRAQAGNIASQLEGGGFDNLQLDARVSAEDIIFILNNNGNRRGYGDFIND